MAHRSEKELAKCVVEWLIEQHWDVYQEVVFGRYSSYIADIAAIRANYLWIIECKNTFSLTVMEQATGWRAHYRSVAIPKAKKAQHKRHQRYVLAKKYFGLGVLEVNSFGNVCEAMAPPLKREYNTIAQRHIKELLAVPERKICGIAGASNGAHWSPYKQTMSRVFDHIKNHPGCTIKEIIDNAGQGHYRTPSSAKTCIRTALISWETDWCKIDKTGKEHKYFIKDGIFDTYWKNKGILRM